MTIADDIEALVKRKRRLNLTEEDIADMLFGQNAYPQRVNSACRQLVKEGRLLRRGEGGPADPFTYHVPPIRRRV
jgi:hypothetical protein